MDTRRHHLLDDDDDLMPRNPEREYTLSTGTILAIFFGLVLVCGLFFAFGYNMGKKATVAPTAATSNGGDSSSDSQFSHFNKPSAGSPAGSSSAITPSAAPAAAASVPSTTTSTTAPSQTSSEESAPAPATSAPVRATPPPVRVSAPAAATPAPMPATSASGSYVVQIAAVSHREDADLLVGALHGKGYSVSARSEPQDKLLHIQVGPFASKKDADAMRQRLLADGYNAIVK